MKKYILTLAAIMTAVLPAIAQYKPSVVTDTLQSKILNAPRAYTVILPDKYNIHTDRHYPVLYLLHGLHGNNSNWANKGDAAKEYARAVSEWMSDEMIIVTPDAGKGYFDTPDWPYEQFFFGELIPQIDSVYRTIPDKSHRAIAGLSMGGGGTISYAQRHPEMFCAAYAMSAWTGLTDEQFSNQDSNPDWVKIIGQSVYDHDCTVFVRNADPDTAAALKTVRWVLDCGDDDFLLQLNLELYMTMKAAEIPCQLRVRDGAHNWRYWQTALTSCLTFVSLAFGK